jgi:hypothetical protein
MPTSESAARQVRANAADWRIMQALIFRSENRYRVYCDLPALSCLTHALTNFRAQLR